MIDTQGKDISDNEQEVKFLCAHCGDPCTTSSVKEGDGYFCCSGCLTVFKILHGSDLEAYYKIENKPGLKPDLSRPDSRFAYLDKDDIKEKLLSFNNEETARISFHIPQIHCSSCIWLLENMYRLNKDILNSRVDFQRRRLMVTFNIKKLPLSMLVKLLFSIGYEPEIKLSSPSEPKSDKSFRAIYARIAVAGFAFGNIMLLSFPEYLGLDSSLRTSLNISFDFIKILLAIPAVLYSGSIYYVSAWHGLKNRMINMDLPIALGISVLFIRSLYDILLAGAPGYLDSLAALIFLLLIGKWYQKKTYFSLSFNRDYRSYLPISVTRISGQTTESIPIDDLAERDRIYIRNNEIIPADAVLISRQAQIDYSYVTGEAAPVNVSAGENVYAGGRMIDSSGEFEVIKKPSKSFLLELWEQAESAVKKQPELTSLVNRMSYYFTPTILLIAIFSYIYWAIFDPSRSVNAAVSVLIVACPCALALSSPFVLGTAQRLMGRANLFLRDGSVVEKLAGLSSIVFDKTGTITQSGAAVPEYHGAVLDDYQRGLIYSVTRKSSHPYSIVISDSFSGIEPICLDSFEEITGKGMVAKVDGHKLKIGSGEWLLDSVDKNSGSSAVYIKLDDDLLGRFEFVNLYRKNLREVVGAIKTDKEVSILSGDNDSERDRLSGIFDNDKLYFNQSPHDKLKIINDKIISGERVGMIGDGLNDAGALRASTVGIAVTEERSTFSPACDGILLGKSFYRLPAFLSLAKESISIIKFSFALSLLYNIIGLFFAVTGNLSPVIAAILMPASSVTVILFTTMMTTLAARKRGII